MSDTVYDDTFYIDGRFPLMGYMLSCSKCGRKILVETALCGTNHNIGVFATCAECLSPDGKFQEDHPEVVKKIEEWKLSK